MTIEQMHDRFDLIQDKYESPYFTSTEKDDFINLAQDVLYTKLDFMPFEYSMQERGITRGFESNEFNSQHLKPFIVPDLTVSISSGMVSDAVINTALQSYTGGSETLHRVIAVSIGGNDVKWVRHNDINRFNRNKYLKGTSDYPLFSYNDSGISIVPDSILSCSVTILRKHKDVSFSGSDDSEFPEYLHHKILYDALLISGVPVKDFDLSALKEYDRSL